MPDPRLTELTEAERDMMSTDADNFPYQKQRGMLYWTGTAWAKWTGGLITALPAGTNTIGGVIAKPTTSGGLTSFRSIDLDETEEEVKATAGQVYGWYFYNNASATTYVKFYNATAANVTVGTTTPVLTIPVPAGSAANVFGDIGIAFSTAITVAATTGVADADTGAPAVNDLIANIFYA